MLDSDLEQIALPVPNLEYLNGFESFWDAPMTSTVFQVLCGLTDEEMRNFMAEPMGPEGAYNYLVSEVEYRARRQAEAYDRIAEELIGSAPPDPLALKGYCPESVEIIRGILSGHREVQGNG